MERRNKQRRILIMAKKQRVERICKEIWPKKQAINGKLSGAIQKLGQKLMAKGKIIFNESVAYIRSKVC